MLILSSHSFVHYGMERFFAFAQELGFEGVEIVVNQNFDTQNPGYLRVLEKRSGVKIKIFSLPSNDPLPYISAFEKIVAEFSGSTINMASPEMFSFGYKNWIENGLPRLVKRHRLIFNRRNMPFKTFLGVIPTRSEGSLYTLREKGDVSLDLPALWQSNEDIMRAASFLAEKMQHVYLGNVHHGKMYTPLPQGILPIESFLNKLARENYLGDFTLKFNPQSVHEGHDDKMLEVINESKQFFEKYFTSTTK